LLDYAHNPAGLRALKRMLDNMDAKPKVGVIAGIGDRRPEDNEEIGAVAAEMFDEIIIRQDKHLRGRTAEELIAMIEKGVRSVDKDIPLTIIPTEAEAIRYAVNNATEGSMIVLCSDVVPDALELVMKFKEQESKKLYKFKKSDIPNIE
jgi:cyanophycin synthetase